MCHARFIELNRLKAHIETHDKTELLDRCLDFSQALSKYEEPEPVSDLSAMTINMPSEGNGFILIQLRLEVHVFFYFKQIISQKK